MLDLLYFGMTALVFVGLFSLVKATERLRLGANDE